MSFGHMFVSMYEKARFDRKITGATPSLYAIYIVAIFCLSVCLMLLTAQTARPSAAILYRYVGRPPMIHQWGSAI